MCLSRKCADIQRPRNIKECLRYITKQDSSSVLVNIPLKETSTLYRAELYKKLEKTTVNWSDFIPSTIHATERKIFEDSVKENRLLKDKEIMAKKVQGLTLRPWQEECLKLLSDSEGDDRSVFWFTDYEGGQGKSKLCQFLFAKKEAAIFHDVDYKNNSFIYNREPYVLFDFPRIYKPNDLRLIEDLKNGCLKVTKYESKRLVFDSPVCVVFSNSLPDTTMLSMDRWQIYTIQHGPLYISRLV